MFRQGRRKRKKGERLNRSLVHIDKQTRDQLAAMSAATSIPQIQLLTLAVSSLANSSALSEVVASIEASEVAASGDQNDESATAV